MHNFVCMVCTVVWAIQRQILFPSAFWAVASITRNDLADGRRDTDIYTQARPLLTPGLLGCSGRKLKCIHTTQKSCADGADILLMPPDGASITPCPCGNGRGNSLTMTDHSTRHY